MLKYKAYFLRPNYINYIAGAGYYTFFIAKPSIKILQNRSPDFIP